MHDEDFFHEHDMSPAEQHAIAQTIIEHDTLELLTVGIDIGSSTSHLLFARVFFQRQGHRLSDQFVVVDRTVEWRSPIQFTPFLPDGTIDAHALSHFVSDCYAQAGFAREDVDSGAVILTGEAVKRANAHAIDEIFARESGRFVCATAGHTLESLLAARGSGAVELSRTRQACGLHIDIGGGTTKLALVDRGEILGVSAFAVGGRLLARDADGDWSRIDESAALVARELGIEPTAQALADPAARTRVVERLAELLVDRIRGDALDPLAQALELTEPLQRPVQPTYLTFSGGVAEYLFGHEDEDFGDIARPLADSIAAQLRDRVRIPAVDAGQRIRATVIGASQFSVQVSGTTIHAPADTALPARNVPVVPVEFDADESGDVEAMTVGVRDRAQLRGVELDGPVALAFAMPAHAGHAELLRLARVVAAASADGRTDALVVVVLDVDLAHALGAILAEEVGMTRPLVVLDGIEPTDLDYLDIGELVDPPGLVPVVVKSLLFL